MVLQKWYFIFFNDYTECMMVNGKGSKTAYICDYMSQFLWSNHNYKKIITDWGNLYPWSHTGWIKVSLASLLTCKGYWFSKDAHRYRERLACLQMIQTPLGNHWNIPSCGGKGSLQRFSVGPDSPAWRQRHPPGSTGLQDTTPTASLPQWSSPHCLRQEIIKLLDISRNKWYSTV